MVFLKAELVNGRVIMFALAAVEYVEPAKWLIVLKHSGTFYLTEASFKSLTDRGYFIETCQS